MENQHLESIPIGNSTYLRWVRPPARHQREQPPDAKLDRVIPGNERIPDTAEGDPVPSTVDDDWPAKVTATVVHYVGTVRDATTGKALVASRTAVYALAMGLIGLVLAVLLLVILIRMLVTVTGYLPFVEPGEAWMAYYILSGIFVIVGAILWHRKEA